MRLSTLNGGTLLEYDVDAKVGGKLAQLGSRIIDGFAKKLAGQFFEQFQNGLEQAPQNATENTGGDTDDPKNQKGWIGRMFNA